MEESTGKIEYLRGKRGLTKKLEAIGRQLPMLRVKNSCFGPFTVASGPKLLHLKSLTLRSKSCNSIPLGENLKLKAP